MNLEQVVLGLSLMILLFNSGMSNPVESSARETKIKNYFDRLDFSGNKPSYEVFYKAMKGYMHLKNNNLLPNERYVTIIDFTMSSNKERLWIVDMKNMKVVYNTLVSHGRNTGEEYAQHFSNILNSGKSSIGFYVTAETYFGKHGFSMRLKGMDKGFNCNAYNRAIVVHSADYVSPEFAKKNGRLGRSLGCPALPPHLNKEIIELIKDGTLMFIYYPDQEYLQKSQYLL
jgi:hypothetical protein